MKPARTPQLALGIRFAALLLVIRFPAVAWAQDLLSGADVDSVSPAAACSLQGTVLDEAGAILAGAPVTLLNTETGVAWTTETDSSGDYCFASLPAGHFKLTVAAHGFASFGNPQISLAANQTLQLPDITLHLAAVSSNVDVTASKREVAEAQMKSEVKQRLLGVLPNFYVVYFNDPAPLTARQKMWLAFRLAIDPVNFGIAAAQAAAETNSKDYQAYGTGAEGFTKRFGAAYADDFVGTVLGSGLIHAALRQDPRYYYKGTGTIVSRALYALSWSFRCKGDNGKWQVNYSSLLGDIASAGISDLYYPKAIRNSAGQTIQYSLLSVASQGVDALLQEFVFKKVTTHSNDPGK
ncbi:MAG: carboxypeptidase regulatory-like domain-containing protein [Acidobacteriaceae bacterium]|nr:carboxypeptidase regulatory-like domain-containing protein [Acidobacteriaceae bacterium]